jgi:hypothetical protein
MIKMLIVPFKALIQQYNIPSHNLKFDTPEGLGIWREYPQIFVHHLNKTQTFGVVDIDVTYDGQDTPRSLRHKELYDRLKVLERDIDSLELQVFKLTEEKSEMSAEFDKRLRDMKKSLLIMNEKTPQVYGEENQPGE